LPPQDFESSVSTNSTTAALVSFESARIPVLPLTLIKQLCTFLHLRLWLGDSEARTEPYLNTVREYWNWQRSQSPKVWLSYWLC
jgi:hypothetical protein